MCVPRYVYQTTTRWEGSWSPATMLTEVRSRTYSADTLIDLIFQTIFGVQEDEVSPEILSVVLNDRQGP